VSEASDRNSLSWKLDAKPQANVRGVVKQYIKEKMAATGRSRGLLTDLAGLAVLVGAGYGVFNEYQKSQQAALPASQRATTAVGGAGGVSSTVVVRENAREFISKLADKGDDVAAKTVSTVQRQASVPKLATLPVTTTTTSTFGDEGFRFDVTREGLIGTISTMLESKRTFETNFINECRRTGRYPPDFAQRCKEMREEKEELKRILDGLQGKKKSWFSFW